MDPDYPKASAAIPTTKMRVTMRIMSGPIMTLATLLIIEGLGIVGFPVPNPAAIYFLAVVLATLTGGAFAGGLSAAITLVYAAFFHSEPGQLFVYSDENLRRFSVLLVTTPAIVIVIEMWRRQHERRSSSRIGELHGELEQRKALAAPLTHLAPIVEGAEDAIYSKDLAGRIMSWNPSAERLYGYTAREMHGKSIAVLMPPDRHHDAQRILNTIMSGGKVEREMAERVRKDGRHIVVWITVSPIRNVDGNIVGASVVARPPN